MIEQGSGGGEGGGGGENIESSVITDRQIQLFIMKQRQPPAHHSRPRKSQCLGLTVWVPMLGPREGGGAWVMKRDKASELCLSSPRLL